MSSANSESATIRKSVYAPGTFKPAAPYSPAVQVDKMLFVSGQLGVDASGRLVPGGIEGQGEQAIANLRAILRAAGGDLGHVVRATVLVASINELDRFNVVYAKHFTSLPRPARVAFQVGALPLGARVELEAIAVLGDLPDGAE